MAHHHNHHGQGQEHHGHGVDFAAGNKEHFSTHVSDFDKPSVTELAIKVTKAMREHFPFDKNSTTVMDFACGAGHISRELGPYSKSIVGVDIVQGLVDVYNKRATEKGISPGEMHAVCAELKGEEGELDGRKFDVITCSMAYHHFGSVEDITKMLAFFLKPGGALLIVDILDKPENATEVPKIPEKYRHVIAHTSGFKEEQFRAVMQGAGLTTTVFIPEAMDFSFIFNEGEENEGSVAGKLFFTKAVKPSA
ncbi:hypothetical protein NLJ89_g4202 [Agrocybe chaxingu]|uniref:S-adenosyl-L-methionine-dependent methyltransferase n=1 Tax=Agrocybe chaxingu TaxID=84603 RepID=A0A9W8K2K4_9AGAR|nr:hypothetical protein NLJ89_g4202 [Agrocybe chaxingu]